MSRYLVYDPDDGQVIGLSGFVLVDIEVVAERLHNSSSEIEDILRASEDETLIQEIVDASVIL